jgi:hypothetical protein
VTQQTLETWEMKAKRLAQELKAATFDPFTSTPKQRQHYAEVRYALQAHIAAVPSPEEET